jgi:hypothetical protein
MVIKYIKNSGKNFYPTEARASSPLGANFDPWVNFLPKERSYPMGVKFYVCPSILLNSRERSPMGVNKEVNIPPRVQSSPLEANHVVKNWPLYTDVIQDV